ncbi:MAG: aspartate dehydrogenase [Clostridia bacterium]|nr:aspartate dehydrogenase [Clostridia bacterium]
MNLFKRKAVPQQTYDTEKWTPVIRSSICTGEKTAGFLEKDTGKFRDVMLIRSGEDLEDFKARYGISGEIGTIY